MAYMVVDTFSGGLETRKSPLTAPPGSLLRLKNASISPGGEIIKRRAFVKVATLTGTFGLAATASSVYAFTRNADLTPPVITVPGVTVKYQKLPNSSATLVQTDYDVYDGKIYFAGHDPAGVGAPAINPHYYNAVVTEGSGKGFAVRTYQSKIYTVGGALLSFSAVLDPVNWTTGTGASYINLNQQDSEAENLVGLEIYYDKMAVMSDEASQIWAVDPDPAQNSLNQLLRATGTNARRSVLQYGSGDILYLAPSGIRSLKARDSSTSAAVTDIGSPLDNLLRDLRLANGIPWMSTAIALLEPVIGRFWMLFPNQIMVLSYFPGPKITAWSTYEVPFTIDHAVTCGERVFIRSGDDLYCYGGDSGQVTDNCGVEVRLPYLDGGKPGHLKAFEAIDATVSGTWRVAVSYNFDLIDVDETLATLNKPTWNTGRVEMQGYASHFSVRFYNDDAGDASIGNLAIHYKLAADED